MRVCLIIHFNGSNYFFLFLSSLAPNSPPINVTVAEITSTTIRVFWQDIPPENKRGDIIAFEVVYVPLETFNGAISSSMLNASGSNFSVTLESLEENVNYSISIQAYTSAGPGPTSPTVHATTLEDSKSTKLLIDKKMRILFEIYHCLISRYINVDVW